MARSFDGSNDDLSVASAVVSAYPFTMACWFNANNFTADQGLMSLYDSATDNTNNHRLNLEATTGKVVARTVNSAGTLGAAVTTAGASSGTWLHACGVWASATSRTAYVNGGSANTNATNLTPGALNATGLGAFLDTVPDRYFNGALMEVAIWNVALGSAEVAVIGSNAICPLLVRPEALVAYWPLIGGLSPEPDYVGGFNLTVNGAVESDHGRMHYGAPSSNPGFHGTLVVGPNNSRHVFVIAS